MKLVMKLNEKEMTLNGSKIKSDCAPIAVNGRTLVPIRLVGESLGAVVGWRQGTKEVTVSNRRRDFATADDCAKDWAMYFNALSTALYVELSGIIYEGEDGYFWDFVKMGETQSAPMSLPEIKKGVAAVHSHGGSKPGQTWQISNGDRDIATKAGKPLYMADSGGTLWKYVPGERNQQKVFENLSASARWTDKEKNAKTMNEYFSDGYFGVAGEYPFGFAADYQNRLAMAGIAFDEAGDYEKIKRVKNV